MIFSDYFKKNLYFSVGQITYICSQINSHCDSFPLTMEVFKKRQRIGVLNAERENHKGLYLSFASDNCAKDVEAELDALRLFSRICSRIDDFKTPLFLEILNISPQGSSMLVADGFIGTGDYCFARLPGKFLRNEATKACTMDAVYDDPFSIPWNFVPMEFDVLQYLESGLLPSLSSTILDIGCGFGKNAQFLDQFGIKVYGVDIASFAIDRCKEIVNYPERFKNASVLALPWANDSFDVILDVGCLHCLSIADREVAIDELTRVMKNSGCILSRFFKPKSQQWIHEQPFEVKSFGLDFEEIQTEFNGKLQLSRLAETEWANYTIAKKLN